MELSDKAQAALIEIAHTVERKPEWVVERLIACAYASIRGASPDDLQDALEAFWLEGSSSRGIWKK